MSLLADIWGVVKGAAKFTATKGTVWGDLVGGAGGGVWEKKPKTAAVTAQGTGFLQTIEADAVKLLTSGSGATKKTNWPIVGGLVAVAIAIFYFIFRKKKRKRRR